MVVKCHRYFMERKTSVHAGAQARVRDSVAECLGISKSTVGSIIAHWNAHHDPTFASTFRPRVRRPNAVSQHFSADIRELIMNANNECLPVTSKSLCNELLMEYDVDINERTMRRVLRKMGYTFVKGRGRFYLAESDANVAFRAKYLRKKLDNRYESSTNPIYPKVFLDESYCNLNHSPPKTWVDNTKLRKTKSSKGPRMCIVGAGVISSTVRGVMSGAWVETSLTMWSSLRKKRKQGREDANEDDDYHGNFTADLFERWFEKLCLTLERTYGKCVIHMDGAKYHKRLLNPSPSAQWKKGDIQDWLRASSIDFEARLTKAELLLIARANRPPPKYATQVIATTHGHTLLYTPPYHPELQPIELVWER
ncbi:hypothetical protein Ae201684P_019700 [Aphanomyces euteiches]|nr:hypothetical protein Ae201684P_019700 [Aphanomyces euteiches]